MKLKNAITLSMICAIMLSCHKDNKVTVNANLTNCPANSECTFNYFDNTDFTGSSALQTGSQRVFAYESVNSSQCAFTSRLVFKIPMGATQFDLSAGQVASAQVAFGQSCVCCDFVAVQPTGGEIKGQRTDASHWLVNAKVILRSADKKLTDTLIVNQYFSASQLITEF